MPRCRSRPNARGGGTSRPTRRIMAARHEDRLPQAGVTTERAGLARPPLEIVAQQHRLRPEDVVGAADRDRVAVAVVQADTPLVDARELLSAVVESLLLHRAPVAVEVPALQRGRPLRGTEVVGAEHGRVTHHVEHDAVTARVVEGVHRVEHVARLDVVPDDVGRVAVARQQSDAGVVPVLPAVRERRAGCGGVQAEGDGEIEQDDGALRDGTVVQAHRSTHGDASAGPHRGVSVDDRHLHVVAPPEEVRDGIELARQRIALGVRGVAARPACRRSRRGRSSRGRCSARTGVRPPRRWRRCAPHGRSHSCSARSPFRHARRHRGGAPRRACAPPRPSAPSGCGTTRPDRRAAGSRAPSRRR